MDLLRPIVKPYAWGSRHALARLQGREEPSDGPEAELWMGAHPAGPAGLTRGGLTTTLQQVVAAAPERELGAACAGRFGGRLPFLLKVLAAEQPLSIQVHPDREQARAGFGALRSGGAAHGPYADDWPKPELLYALTSFEVLAGFRSRDEAVAVLEGLGLARLRRVTHMLRDSGGSGGSGSNGDGAAALGDALRTVLEWPRDDRAALVHAVVEASRRRAALPGPHAAAYDAVARMAEHHPGDLGLVASLLLRHRVLEPGTALFVPAGGLHSYIRGVGVELMAGSDNVLRAGLTTKEVDIPELLRITDPAVPVPVVRPERVPGSERTRAYRCPVEEFALYRVRLGGRPEPVTPPRGPRIALCAEGTVLLRGSGGQEVPLGPGASCFLPDSDRDVTAEGDGTLFVAATGLSPGHR